MGAIDTAAACTLPLPRLSRPPTHIAGIPQARASVTTRTRDRWATGAGCGRQHAVGRVWGIGGWGRGRVRAWRLMPPGRTVRVHRDLIGPCNTTGPCTVCIGKHRKCVCVCVCVCVCCVSHGLCTGGDRGFIDREYRASGPLGSGIPPDRGPQQSRLPFPRMGAGAAGTAAGTAAAGAAGGAAARPGAAGAEAAGPSNTAAVVEGKLHGLRELPSGLT